MAKVNIKTKKYAERPGEWFDEWIEMKPKRNRKYLSKVHIQVMYGHQYF